MQIKDLMTSDVGLIDPATKISEASRMMRDGNVGVLPVAQDDRLFGMITDRGVVVRTLAKGKGPKTPPARDAKHERLLYCLKDRSPDEVAAKMGEKQISRLPVLNRDKRLVGIVFLGALSTGRAAGEAG